MSGEYDSLIADDQEKQPEIQQSEETILKSDQANTSHVSLPGVVAFKDVIGVTQDKELLDKIEAVNIDVSTDTTPIIKIQKVPEIMLRNEDVKKYFKPRELSIGPFHAVDPSLFKMELKLKLAAHFIQRRKRSGELLLEDIRTNIEEIKMHFVEEVIKAYSEDEFIWLLFLDGCAMLEFIHSFVNRSLNVFNISNGQAALIQQDLFLLENQIPLQVLDVLMDTEIYCWPCKGDLENDFFRFIFTSTISNFPRDSKNFRGPFFRPRRKPVHILDLLRYAIVMHDKPSINLFCILAYCWGCNKRHRSNVHNVPEDWSKKQSFRNVQELKTTGIKFKTTYCLKEVSFRPRFFIMGQLKLPTFIVDDSTPHMLFNLVAYEMCLPNNEIYYYHRNLDNSWITSYVSLIDLLVDNEQDIKDLRAADILRNNLSSDIEAANMINSIGSYCIAPSKDTYEHVKYGIEKLYRRKCAIWMAQVCQVHFSSPLTIVALVAATALLALTVVQTWYAVNPK